MGRTSGISKEDRCIGAAGGGATGERTATLVQMGEGLQVNRLLCWCTNGRSAVLVHEQCWCWYKGGDEREMVLAIRRIVTYY